MKKLTIKHAQALAKKRKGKCLSSVYINNNSPLEWECDKGHQWKAAFADVNGRKTWCPHCSGNAKLSLEYMKNLAASKNGKCLSTKYINGNTKLLWECESGHQWESLYSPIKSGKMWCPYCSGRKQLIIDDNHTLKLENNKNENDSIALECMCGHQWDTASSNIQNNRISCPQCVSILNLTIEYMHELAKSKNGKCLSIQYKDINSKLKWECQYGHEWYATPSDVFEGSWCKECSDIHRYGKNAVRDFFELIFNKKFPSSQPAWLRFEGNPMELNGYCDSLKIAFEYQGRLPLDKKIYWLPDKKDNFKRIKFLDSYKSIACRKHGVTLLKIHELDPTKNPTVWKKEIRKKLISSGIKIPEIFDEIPFTFNAFFKSKHYLNKAHASAQSKKGLCLSNLIFHTKQYVEWQCNKDHRWKATLHQMLAKNTWCPNCAGKVKHTISEMRELAKSKKGKCLSSEYINSNTKLLWECKYGHQWQSTPSSILTQGTWCRDCAGKNKLTISQMQKLAKSKKGKCLSKEYTNSKTKLLWECKYGHRWEAVPHSIKSHGTWCPKCNKVS